MNMDNRLEVPKAYFGKFQPDLYFMFSMDKSNTLESHDMFHNDILVQFKNKIDEEFKLVTYMTSGKVRFSIRGFFHTGDKNWFIPNDKGPHLLSCIWSRETEFGIDSTGCMEEILYQTKKYSSSKNTCYSYIITNIDQGE